MNNSKIGVSIVLPTLNEKENLQLLIPELINVVNKNDIENYEIIVVDDNSTDDTSLYIESLQTKNKNIAASCKLIFIISPTLNYL